jgi:hypothetical protein
VRALPATETVCKTPITGSNPVVASIDPNQEPASSGPVPLLSTPIRGTSAIESIAATRCLRRPAGAGALRQADIASCIPATVRPALEPRIDGDTARFNAIAGASSYKTRGDLFYATNCELTRRPAGARAAASHSRLRIVLVSAGAGAPAVG